MKTQRQKNVRNAMLTILLIVIAAACMMTQQNIYMVVLLSLCWLVMGLGLLSWLLPLLLIGCLAWAIIATVTHRTKTQVTNAVVSKALLEVGNTSPSDGFKLLDIGILAYDGGKRPKVSRSEAIPAYTTQLRPFLIINFTEAHPAQATIKLEIVDDLGQLRFTDEQVHNFQHGKNFFTPHHWLNLKDGEQGGDWTLRVSIDDRPLALHAFTVKPDVGTNFRSYLRPDGEIDEWLSKSAASAPTDSLSLDELIGDQSSQSHESRSR